MDEQEVAARRAFGARFEEEMARLGTNPDALAPRVGMNRGTLFNYKKGDRVPDAVGLLALHRAGGMDLRFLVTGERGERGGVPASYRLPEDLQGVEVSLQVAEAHGAQWRERSPRAASTTNSERGLSSPAIQGKTVPGGDALLPVTRGAELRPVVLGLTLAGSGRTMEYEVIPRVCGGALAGSAKRPHAAEELVFDRVGEFAMSRDWLARNLNHTSGDLASVHVIGDSMAPTLLDGDVVVIDRGVREVTVDAIYLVAVSGRRLVKRLQRKIDGSVVIISDNASYERETIAAHRVDQIEVLGRLVWPRVR